ncbi:putative house-cleaning noncanonical NTP pyrophosphatase (MazG superfamily) [Neobacillus bataviensis]|uniref:Putative house-cleaning noncanonical NTP pyrophosphatase (MazG superfamily) n=1 Tax=Neobacillus bataviensis TaxID=220685 RepID=A0A561D0I6_9BACI|nr:nucleoside triphosphate pyrophosphohydrolase [Neobacillus bataviensis]TWD96588.1 putative house-cleaning noncanonical NTP pyrophosphatase (MazG superfamily) [Neobacillus bataviensis]
MTIYNKLVRDRVPEIIKSNGKHPSIRILEDVEYIRELKNKCYEELEEYMKADNVEDQIEELSDLLEVIYALAQWNGSSVEMVEEIRRRKKEERGGFKEKFYLIEVDD